MAHAARHVLRLQKVPSLLGEVRVPVPDAPISALPGNATGEVTNYPLVLRNLLARFLEYSIRDSSSIRAEISMSLHRGWRIRRAPHRKLSELTLGRYNSASSSNMPSNRRASLACGPLRETARETGGYQVRQ